MHSSLHPGLHGGQSTWRRHLAGWRARACGRRSPSWQACSGGGADAVSTPQHTKPGAHAPPGCRGATPRDFRVLPRHIILVRHAESEGNVDNVAYTYLPDPKVMQAACDSSSCSSLGTFEVAGCGCGTC